jgi:hypothetical protein
VAVVSTIIKPGAGIIFMKVGTHAQEPLEAIITRKQKEIAEAGIAMWGYGGGTCHPLTMVQPFAKSFEKKGGAIYLCMEEMQSRHFAEPKRAEQSSADGFSWQDIPEPINVLGSRYALVIDELREETVDLPLAATKVAIGNQLGRAGHLYISGRVDKACLEITEPTQDAVAGPDEIDRKTKAISLVARLAPPYAVFLRNRL